MTGTPAGQTDGHEHDGADEQRDNDQEEQGAEPVVAGEVASTHADH